MHPSDLLTSLRDDPGLAQVLGRANAVLSVPEPARAPVVAALAGGLSRRHPLLVATSTSPDAERLTHDLTTLLGAHRVELFPAWETLPFERVSPAVETMGRRLRVRWRLTADTASNGSAGSDTGTATAPAVVVAPVRALLQRLGPLAEDPSPIVLAPGQQVDQEALVERLVDGGYRREYQVEHRGEVAVRGSIVDVFPTTADSPVRVDLWGDEVDRLTRFSVNEQRSTDELEGVEIYGCRELPVTPAVRKRAEQLVGTQPWGREQWERLAEGQLFDGMESWLPWLVDDDELITDLLDDEAQVLLVEPRRMRDRAADLLAEEDDLARTLAQTWGAIEGFGSRLRPSGGEGGSQNASELARLHVPFERLLARTEAPAWSLTTVPESPETPTVQSIGWNPVVGDAAGLVRQLTELLGDRYRVALAADGEGSAARLSHLLAEQGVELDGVVAPLERGFILPGAKVAVLTEADLTGRRRAHRRVRPRAHRDAQRFFDDLKAGDYVVHHQHGVARYGGMVRRGIGGVERDYLLLEYRGNDRLYVPSDQIDAVRPYSGGEEPNLSRLSGGDWQRTKARVRAEVDKIAQELVVLYQKRLHTAGHPFGADTPWQHEMEDAFAYLPTPDQAKAVDDVKADMEAGAPMDRLVCGDVGFGKTEVAIRAAFKAIQDDRQVAVLVPTTLLASQHFTTFSERFAGYPVRVEMLSRFLTNAEARRVVDGLASGEVDCVIGTHRLLSDDIAFKRLGLLVVDEEQRFGVTHKERIKSFHADVDVLTLTATPIPRTLEMSLTGIRDLSLLNTPPADRQPILTYVGSYDERAVAEAIRRELLREGQVFFVHNRVQDIDDVASGLRELVPEARIAVAHGQMDEGTLERVVFDFWEGAYDVLVCTTIIESGIDMPTVNTLVVDRADRLGLGQLHQLRGRVGRAGQRAYAYLFHPPDRVLTEEAYERLRTIGEATELGSGFRIAMRDLEIRGAGNLLGTGQSGHIAAVGYDLYCQMVSEAVSELKGEPVREPAEIKLDLPLDANLPADYVEREDLRLEAYRRLADVTTDGQVDDIEAEWVDRYGPIPEPAQRLLQVARLRAECARLGIRECNVSKGPAFGGPAYTARLSPLELRTSQQIRLRRLAKGAVYKDESQLLVLPIPRTPHLALALVELLRELVPARAAAGEAEEAPAPA